MTDADNKTTKIAKGLLPGKEYFVKFKVKDGEEESEWSKLYSFTTITNNAQPAVPGNIDINFQGTSAVAYWDTVTLDVNGKKSNVERYELQFRKNASDANPKAVSVPQSSETRLQWEITLKQNLSWWTTSQTSIDFRVRAVNKSGIASNWSTWDTGTSAGPAAPTNFSATGDINAINLKWTRSTSVNVVKYNLHYALTSSFTPNTANLVWSGDADAYTFRTGTYQPHYFQLSAEDEFGRISTYVTANAEPESPFGADGVAPDLPTGLSVTAGGTAPNKVANVSWTFNATGATNEDIQSFAIRWRKVGDTNWGIEFADKAARTLAIPLPQPFANYEFQIASVDWVANYSAYSATVTLTQAIPGPPPQLAAPTATGSVDGLAIKWTASTAADVVSGGYYEVNIATNTGFTTGLLTYNTGNTYIDVNGLSSNTTYYVRVRAVDVEGLQGTWSATLTTATTSFPVTPLSDGNIPASSPAATVTGGIGYLFVNWTATTNQDPVTYEVHISTTNNFTPSGVTKVAETPATNIVLEKDAAGANLVYGTTYYVKLLSKDRDGSASAYGTQGSGSLTKGTISDLTLAASDVGAYTTTQTDNAILTSSNGKNKITYATAAPVNGTNTGILGDTWYVRQSTTPFQITSVYELTTAPSTWTQRKLNGLTIDNLDAGSVTTGFLDADRLQARSINVTKLVVSDTSNLIKEPRFEFAGEGWTDINGSTIAIVTVSGASSATSALRITSNGTGYPASYMRDTIPVKPGEEYHIIGELFREVNAGTFTVRAVYTDKNNLNPTYQGILVSSTTNAWQTLSGSFAIPADKYFLRIWVEHALGTSGTNGFVTGLNLRRRQTGELIVDGSIQANKITAGTYTGGAFVIGAGGILRTNNSEVTITSSGISVTGANSSITASSLTTGTFASGQALTVNGNMTIQGNTTIAASGYISSTGYIATGNAGATGFRLSAAGLDIVSGTISVGTLVGGTISSADIRVGANGYLTVDAGGVIKSNNYNGTAPNWNNGTTGWALGPTGLHAPGLSISASNVTGDTIAGRTLSLSSGGSITSSGFSLSSTGLSLTSGTINGAAVYTNQLRSNTQISDGVTSRYTFNINGSGYAEVTGLRVYGDTILGSNSGSFIQSSSVSGTNGWRIYGSGSAEFYNLTISGNSTFNGTITANTSSTFNGTITANAGGTFGGTIYANMIAGVADPDADGDGTVLPFATKGKMRQGLVVRNGLTVRSQTDMTGFGVINVAFITGPSNGPEIRGNGVRINSLGQNAGSNGTGTRYVQCDNNGVLTSSTSTISTREVKHDIRPIELNSDTIMSLVPVHYRFDYEPDELRTGFIAEDVHDAGLNQFVGYEDSEDPNKPTGLFYQDIGVAHFAVTQEHHEEIKSLRAEVEQLKALVQTLLDNQ